MRLGDVIQLFEYMYWVNHRLLTAAARLTDEQFTAHTDVTTRDLRATLVHELDVEWSWRLSLQGRTIAELDAEGELRPEDYPKLAALRDHWQRDEAVMREWLASMTDEQVEAEVVPSLSDASLPLGQYLLHIVFHAAQQQADAATLLTLAGHSPGEIGYLEWVWTLR
jgi:uncharacterized damage-inducible protein DinB